MRLGTEGGSESVRVFTPERPPWSAHLNPCNMFTQLIRMRGLILKMAWRELLGRYKGTHFGLLWSIISPLLMLGVYYFVFGIILEARFTDVERSAEGPGFALTLFCGIVVYNMFSSSVSKAPLLILERKSYVKKVVFPSEILAVALLLAGMFQGMISFIILLAALIISSVTIPWTIALFPIVLLPLMALTLGAIWYLAFAGVFFRDISHMVMALLQLLFFASPVIYTLAQVPEGYQSMLRLNPLTTILEDARRTLLWGNTPDWFWWFIVMIVSLIVMHSGYMWFMKLKRDFADTI